MATEITRSAFDKLSPADRMQHVRDGGTVINDPEPAPRKLKPGEVARAAFDKMTAEERAAVVRAGTPIVDVDE